MVMYWAYRYKYELWARYNYILAAAFDSGCMCFHSLFHLSQQAICSSGRNLKIKSDGSGLLLPTFRRTNPIETYEQEPY